MAEHEVGGSLEVREMPCPHLEGEPADCGVTLEAVRQGFFSPALHNATTIHEVNSTVKNLVWYTTWGAHGAPWAPQVVYHIRFLTTPQKT